MMKLAAAAVGFAALWLVASVSVFSGMAALLVLPLAAAIAAAAALASPAGASR